MSTAKRADGRAGESGMEMISCQDEAGESGTQNINLSMKCLPLLVCGCANGTVSNVVQS